MITVMSVTFQTGRMRMITEIIGKFITGVKYNFQNLTHPSIGFVMSFSIL